jgi:hypothetical protein
MEKTNEHKEKREALKALSQQVKPLVKEGQYDTVNDAIMDCFYRQNGHSEFNTLWEWNKKGYRILKGSKAFVVWGSPRQLKKVEPETDEDKKEEFFPLCYLFSNLQVEQSERRAA